MKAHIDALADMALFVEVARLQSFRVAAQRLDMPVSTLSRRITAMERRMGTSLLVRTTRSVRLAESARAYYNQCAAIVDAAAQAQGALLSSVDRSERLRISMPVDLGADLLGPLIASYATTKPGLEIEFDLTSTIRDPFRDPVDLIFRVGKPIDDRIVARQVATVRAGLYASPCYLKKCGVLDKPEDLNVMRCINLKMSQGFMPWTIGRNNWAQAPGDASKFAANSIALLCRLAEQSHGVALLPLHVAHAAVKAGKLQRVLPHERIPGWPLYAITVSRLIPTQVRDMLTYLRHCLKADTHME